MNKRNSSLLIFILLIVTFISGCGHNNSSLKVDNSIESQENTDVNMSEDFYFIIEDIFTLQDRNDLVVVGANQNSAMYTGAEVDVLSTNGRIQTQILGIEVYETGLVDNVEEGSNVGIILSDVSAEQVKSGDIIVLRGKGMVTDEVNAMVTMISLDDSQNCSELVDRQTVQIKFFNKMLEATVDSIEIVEESENNILNIKLKFLEPIACINLQTVVIYDEADSLIASGRIVSNGQ